MQALAAEPPSQQQYTDAIKHDHGAGSQPGGSKFAQTLGQHRLAAAAARAAHQPNDSAPGPNAAMFEAEACLASFQARLMPILEATEKSMAMVAGSHYVNSVPLLKQLSKLSGTMIMQHAPELAELIIDEILDETAQMLNRHEDQQSSAQAQAEQCRTDAEIAAEVAASMDQFDDLASSIERRLACGYQSVSPPEPIKSKLQVGSAHSQPKRAASPDADRRLQSYRMLYKEQLVSSAASFRECGVQPWELVEMVSQSLVDELLEGAAEQLLETISGYADTMLSTELPEQPPVPAASPQLDEEQLPARAASPQYRELAPRPWDAGSPLVHQPEPMEVQVQPQWQPDSSRDSSPSHDQGTDWRNKVSAEVKQAEDALELVAAPRVEEAVETGHGYSHRVVVEAVPEPTAEEKAPAVASVGEEMPVAPEEEEPEASEEAVWAEASERQARPEVLTSLAELQPWPEPEEQTEHVEQTREATVTGEGYSDRVSFECVGEEEPEAQRDEEPEARREEAVTACVRRLFESMGPTQQEDGEEVLPGPGFPDSIAKIGTAVCAWGKQSSDKVQSLVKGRKISLSCFREFVSSILEMGFALKFGAERVEIGRLNSIVTVFCGAEADKQQRLAAAGEWLADEGTVQQAEFVNWVLGGLLSAEAEMFPRCFLKFVQLVASKLKPVHVVAYAEPVKAAEPAAAEDPDTSREEAYDVSDFEEEEAGDDF